MSHHRTNGFRVAAPTLDPDPVFLGVLADLSASSRPTHIPRTARSAGLRMMVATASVAVIATATWAAGSVVAVETPLSPADSPAPMEITSPPSHGDAGTPHSDVSSLPDNPLSPGLSGNKTFQDGEDAVGGKDATPDVDGPGKSQTAPGQAVADEVKKQGNASGEVRPDTPDRKGIVPDRDDIVPDRKDIVPGPGKVLTDASNIAQHRGTNRGRTDRGNGPRTPSPAR